MSGSTNPKSLIEALQHTAETVPDCGVTVYDRRGQSADRRTSPQMVAGIRESALKLAAAGIGENDRVLICLPTTWDLLNIYLGAICRGAYPVLVAPSTAMGSAAAQTAKIAALVNLLKPARLVCDPAMRVLFKDYNGTELLSITATPEELFAFDAKPLTKPVSAGLEDIAFMQLTSGSTGRQRAVKISHRAVLHNVSMIAAFANTARFGPEKVVSWLPLNHDMGLVGALFAMVLGYDLFLHRPDAFLARPKIWLQTISEHRATLSPAPNFAYQLCLERIEEQDLQTLDLSSWRVAFTGAEMIRADTCSKFVKRFGVCGFRPEFFHPCYGMAESTLALTCDSKITGVRTYAAPSGQFVESSMKDVVCTGGPGLETTIKICPPGQPERICEDRTIGEIWASGPSIFSGYYNDEEATRESLVNGWLRTGDLGFMIDGELYITGRTKDILIINGQNIMPHEIEWLAESVSGGGGTERSGAFSVSSDLSGEQAVIVVEVPANKTLPLAEADREIRVKVGREMGLTLSDLIFVKRGQIPKTTSGKVQRAELRRRYLAGSLERLPISE